MAPVTSKKRFPLSTALLVGLIAVCCAAIGSLRSSLADRFHKLKVTSDVYALPSPQQTVAISLGYRAALADLIWGNLLVSFGLHFQEKRRFEFVGNYLDTINALDPRYEVPYRFADTLLTMRPQPPTLEDYQKAREIFERGMNELPYSAELWSTAGQFLAYLAPPQLPTEAMKAEWRLAGAQAMSHACELSDASSNIPYHCIAAAGILNRAGNREAVIQMLSRTLAVNDNEEIRRMALGFLGKAINDREREKHQRRLAAFQDAVSGGPMSFLSKDAALVAGPEIDTARCSGLGASHNKECVTTWQAWATQLLPPVTDEG